MYMYNFFSRVLALLMPQVYMKEDPLFQLIPVYLPRSKRETAVLIPGRLQSPLRIATPQ
jgi:hypothetical protein